MPSRRTAVPSAGFSATLVSAGAIEGLDSDAHACVALGVRAGDTEPQIIDPTGVLGRLEVDGPQVLRSEKATGGAGEVIAVPVGRDGIDRVLLVGVGEATEPELRKASAAAVRRSGGCDRLVSGIAAGADVSGLRAVVEAAGLAAYRFSRRSEPPKSSGPQRLELLGIDGPAAASDAVQRAAAMVDAVSFARDLTNTPSLEKSPQWLADQARRAGEAAGLRVTIRDEQALRDEGFGGVVAVGAGSERPPRLVQMEYDGGGSRHIVLVGKGITFDAGGLSLKPNDSMVAMKTDMGGAAAVIATMTALKKLGVKHRVTALTPLAENLPSGSATRPGDVVRHWGGRTSEVLNTDAEGRLVLADAIAYAAATLRPDTIVDLATLTGAATLGLGRRDAPLYTTCDRLRGALVAAGAAAGERLWPMPLVEDYAAALVSPIADQRNIADPKLHFSGGSIMAALFLREFTAGVEWGHLDIAGTGRADSDDGEISKGATGFGVRTLLRWLERS